MDFENRIGNLEMKIETMDEEIKKLQGKIKKLEKGEDPPFAELRDIERKKKTII